MKKWIYNIGWVMMAFVTLSLTSCDDDADIARTLEGTWEGNMYAGTDYHGNYYKALYSQVCFLRDAYTYSSSSGYWVDYYDTNYWGNYDYVASHIEWTVNWGTIRVYFVEDDDYVEIYNYSLDYDYFTGYIETANGGRQKFNLRHVSSPNWGGYYYGGYDSYYYYGNSTTMQRAPAKDNALERPKRVFRVKE